MVSTGGTVERIAGDLDDVTAQLQRMVDGFGERWRGRLDERDASTYAAGVLHGLCIALAVVTGQDSDALLHSQMSGEPIRERPIGEVRVVPVGGHRWQGGGGFVVERWDGQQWERLP